MQNYTNVIFGLTLNKILEMKNNCILLLVGLTSCFLEPQVDGCHRFKGRALSHPAHVQKL